jgi:hypothetical protein
VCFVFGVNLIRKELKENINSELEWANGLSSAHGLQLNTYKRKKIMNVNCELQRSEFGRHERGRAEESN